MIDMVGLHKWCANRSFGTHCGHRVLKKTPGLEVLCFKNFNFVFISIIIFVLQMNLIELGHLLKGSVGHFEPFYQTWIHL